MATRRNRQRGPGKVDKWLERQTRVYEVGQWPSAKEFDEWPGDYPIVLRGFASRMDFVQSFKDDDFLGSLLGEPELVERLGHQPKFDVRVIDDDDEATGGGSSNSNPLGFEEHGSKEHLTIREFLAHDGYTGSSRGEAGPWQAVLGLHDCRLRQRLRRLE